MKLPVDPYLLLFQLQEKVVASSYFKLIVVSVLVFIFVVLLALVRKHVFQLSFRGAMFGFILGVLLMVFVDLIVVFGISDKEKLRQLFTKTNRQEAATEVVSSGISNLSHVLGTSVTALPKKQYTRQEVLDGLLFLPEGDTQKIRDLLCPR